MDIIPATPRHAAQLARVRNAAWRSAYRGLVPPAVLAGLDDAAKARRLARGIQAGTDLCFLLRKEGRAAGMCTLRAAGDCGEIKSLYLLAEHWGTGLGGALLAFAETALSQMGCHRATLWTPEINRRARQFYTRHGYAPTGARRALDLGGPQWAAEYEKSL